MTPWRNSSKTSFRRPRRRSPNWPRSGSPSAAPILEALGDNRLLIDPVGHILVYRDHLGRSHQRQNRRKAHGRRRQRFQEGARQQPTSERDRSGARRAHARQSRTFQASRSGGAVFKSRDSKALKAVEAALAKETDPRAAEALRQARAAILASDTSAPTADRVAAIETLKARGDEDAQGLIDEVAAKTDSPEIKAAAASALASIKIRLRDLECRSESGVRRLRFVGAAARRHRFGDHLRRDGRHQHGAWRNGDAGGVHHFRRAEPVAAIAVRNGRSPSRCRWRFWSPERWGC